VGADFEGADDGLFVGVKDGTLVLGTVEGDERDGPLEGLGVFGSINGLNDGSIVGITGSQFARAGIPAKSEAILKQTPPNQ
jgi:hypothetical protein